MIAADVLKNLEERGIIVRFVIGRRLTTRFQTLFFLISSSIYKLEDVEHDCSLLGFAVLTVVTAWTAVLMRKIT